MTTACCSRYVEYKATKRVSSPAATINSVQGGQVKRSPLLVVLVILMGAHGDVNQPPEVGFVSLASCEVTKKEVGWYAKARAEYANPEQHNGGKAWEKVIAIEGDAERAARDCGKWVEETGKAQRKANGAKSRGHNNIPQR